MIVKNEALGIERTLASMLPAVDRWLILDTGSTDGTQDIIRRVMAPKVGQLVEEPPILYADTKFFDYAANRNRLLALAGTDCAWLLTCDGDDVLHGAEALRSFAESHRDVDDGHQGYRIRMQDDPSEGGYCFDSFRLIRSSAVAYGLHYEMPAHEVLVPVTVVPPRVPVAAMTHFPGPLDRLTASMSVQAEMLEHFIAHLSDEDKSVRPWVLPRATYYLAQAHWSIEHWDTALGLYLDRARMGGNEEEVYEALRRAGICACKAGKPWAEAQQYFLAAHTARPCRAEALLELAKHYWQANNMALAHLFSAPLAGGADDDMGTVDRDASNKLRVVHEAAAHFLGSSARGKYAGLPSPATRRRLKFSLIHATRGRAGVAAEVWKRWKATASGLHDYEYIVSLDEDDAASRAVSWPDGAIICTGPDGGGSVAAYNRGCWVSTGDVVVQVQDDIDPPQHWDSEIAARIPDPGEPQLLRVSDGTDLNRDREVPPLTVLIGTMAYFRQCGYMYHPSYIHCYGDDDHAWKGKREGIITEARELVFSHTWEGPDHDMVARRNYGDVSVNAGARALEERKRAGFPDCPELWPASFSLVDGNGAVVAEGMSRDEMLREANAP